MMAAVTHRLPAATHEKTPALRLDHLPQRRAGRDTIAPRVANVCKHSFAAFQAARDIRNGQARVRPQFAMTSLAQHPVAPELRPAEGHTIQYLLDHRARADSDLRRQPDRMLLKLPYRIRRVDDRRAPSLIAGLRLDVGNVAGEVRADAAAVALDAHH